MGTKTKVGGAVLVAAVCLYFVTRSPRAQDPTAESPQMHAVEQPPVDEDQLVDAVLPAVEHPIAEAGLRSPVAEEPSVSVSATGGKTVLRVVLEGITEESARMAKVTVTGVDTRRSSTAEIRPSWPCQGLTSEFDLDSFFARVAERHENLIVDELGVEIEHPLHLREKTWIPMSRGVKEANGQTVYKLRERLSQPVFWPQLTLAVRDAKTRAHLHQVELQCVPTHYMHLRQQPGTSKPYSAIGSDLSSPITLLGGHAADDTENLVAGVALGPGAGESPQLVELAGRVATERAVMVYARAPGYAWGRIVLDFSSGTERELLLGPAATLDVRLRNVQLARYATLEGEATLSINRLHPNGDESYVRFQQLDETLETEGLQLDGLDPGEYVVAVQLGGEWSHKKQKLLAREAISLAAFEKRELLMVVADPPAPPVRATLGGVVSFPAFGGKDKVRLLLYETSTYKWGGADVDLGLDDMEPGGGEFPTWSFHVESLPVGLYQAQLLPFLTNWMIEVPAGGREDVKLVIPELAEAIVETVDAQTGERIPLEELRYFHRQDLPGLVHDGWKFADLVEPGRFHFWTAPGKTTVGTLTIPNGLDYDHRQWKDLQLVRGSQTVRFELAAVFAKIHFEFRDGDAALPRGDGIWIGLNQGIRAVGHEGHVTNNKLFTDRLVEVSAPGIYEVSFEGVGADHFHPIPPRRVEVRAGETAEVIVELRRK